MKELWLKILSFLLREARIKGMELEVEEKLNGIELRCYSKSFSTRNRFGVDWFEAGFERTYTVYYQETIGSELPDDWNVKVEKRQADEIYQILQHIKYDGVVL